jgi:hypothetical protein
MKKIFLILTLTSLSVFSQSNFGLGLKGTANDFDKYQGGFSFGITSEIKINDKLSLSPEIFFLIKQTYAWRDKNFNKFRDKNNNIINGFDFESQVINIPLKINYYLTKKFYLKTGLDLNYRLNVVGYDWAYEDNTIKELLGNVKKIDFGILIGLGYNFNKTFSVRLYRNFGITNAINKEVVNSLKNSYFSLALNFNIIK